MSNSKFAFNLSQKLKWPHTQEEWDVLNQCGSLITVGTPPHIDATAVLTQYTHGAALGMVLIDPAKQRTGIGTALTLRILRTMEDNAVGHLVLTASHAAEILYSKAGFQKIGDVFVFNRGFQSPAMLPLKEPILFTADEIAHEFYQGCPVRQKILEKMITGSGTSVSLKSHNGKIEGFASSFKRISADGRQSLAIGPIVTNNAKTVGRLLDVFSARAYSDLTCFVFQNISGESKATTRTRKAVLNIFKDKGFSKTDELQFMAFGGGSVVKQYLDPHIVSPMSLAFG